MDRNLEDNLTDGIIEEAVPTFDYETEKAVLSLCMRSKETCDNVVNQLSAVSFADRRNQLIFEAIYELSSKNENIDRFTVYEALESLGTVNQAGGTEYLFNVANVVATKSNLSSYISVIKEKYIRRRCIETLGTLSKKASDGVNDINDVVAVGIDSLGALQTNDSNIGFESIDTIIRSSINNMVRISSGEKEDTYKTLFSALDVMTGGFRPGTLNILAARPGMGKTALVINIATNVASMGRPVNIFSLEMSKSEIGNRILASRTNYSAKQLQRANTLKKDDLEKIANEYSKIANFPIYIDDRSAVTPVSMLTECKKLKRDGKLGLVIVDYLQLMSIPTLNKNSSRQNEISEISRSLKILAKDLNVPVIALSQLSRGSEQRTDHIPMLSDLRDSGAIEQDADCVLFINREGYYSKTEEQPEIEEAQIIVAKNRHGETGKVPVLWCGSKTLFFERDRKRDPQDPVASGMISESSDKKSGFTRTTSEGAAAADYNFDDGNSAVADVEPVFDDVPFDPGEAPPENPENSAFFGGSSDDFPPGMF